MARGAKRLRVGQSPVLRALIQAHIGGHLPERDTVIGIPLAFSARGATPGASAMVATPHRSPKMALMVSDHVLVDATGFVDLAPATTKIGLARLLVTRRI
ncbi:MAG: hypothetical protein EOO77_30345 [Oxalobacteraceae bacterium]|nr:MAG: hypothetical protein EOO77_30345 [Oxalobacteraceae bacterium]